MPLARKIIEGNKRGLFAVAIGEGNIPDTFALELQNSRIASNGEVSKRRGRTRLNTGEIFTTSFFDSWAQGTFSSDVGGFADASIRMKIPASSLTDSGNRIRLTFQGDVGNAEDCKFDSCYVGHAASSGNDWDFASAPTQVLFSTAAGGTVPKNGGTLVSDTTTFTWDQTSDLIVAMDINSDTSKDVVPTAAGTGFAFYSKASADEASETAPTGYTAVSDVQRLISKVEMQWSGPDILSVPIFIGDFTDTYEVLAYGGRDLRRYTPATGKFDTVIKTGLADNTRLYWSMFSKRMVFANGVDNMFKYGYAPQPAVPTLGTTTSGAKAERTYYVKVTYVTANGETVASESASQLVPANDVLTVTSPAAFSGATGWNVYYSTTSGSELKQNSSAIDIGTDHTEDTGSLLDGDSPPTTNDAWFCVDLQDSPPKCKYLISINSRLWGAGIPNDKTRFVGCAVNDEDDWTTGSNAVDINIAPQLNIGDEIIGLSRLGQGGQLILALKNHIITYSVPQTFSDISIDKKIFNTGGLSHRAMGEVDVDNYIVDLAGLTSVKNEIIVQGLRTKKLSDNIKDRLLSVLSNLTDSQSLSAVNYKNENEFIINVPEISSRYIYNYQLRAWFEDRGVTVYESVLAPDGYVLSACDGGYVRREYKDASGNDIYGDDNNSTDVAWRWDTPWLWLNSVDTKKLFKYFQFKGSGGFFDMAVYFDFEDTAYKTYKLQSTPSFWDEGAWDTSYWDFPDINKTLIPMIGRGKSVKFSFTADHASEVNISFYGVSFVPAGFRGND